MTSPTLFHVTQKERSIPVTLTDVLLFIACAFSVVGMLKVIGTQMEIISVVGAQKTTLDAHSREVATIEKARSIQADEVKFFLSQIAGRPLAVPSSLWNQLRKADREALEKEMEREPIKNERGSPRRRPTDP